MMSIRQSKKLLLGFGILAGLLLNALVSKAQCEGGRYIEPLFPDEPILTSDLIYGSNKTAYGDQINLLLDVYEPAGDQLDLRPLIILAHGGSFLFGSKTSYDVEPLAKDLAKVGYVTASIDYRVGMTNYPIGVQHGVDTSDAAPAIIRGMHDGRAAVRYFRRHVAEEGNTFRIDTSKIFFAGISAGGFIALHLAYLDELNEMLQYIDTTGITVGPRAGQPGMHGGVEGASGNAGYSSRVRAVINTSGAILDTSMMKKGNTPVLCFHGTLDRTVPYDTRVLSLFSSIPLFSVSGSYSVTEQAARVDIGHCLVAWEGADHVPQVGNSPVQKAYYDSMLVSTKNFLLQFTCGYDPICGYALTLGTEKSAGIHAIRVYPNPANETLLVETNTNRASGEVVIECIDITGKVLKSIPINEQGNALITREGLGSGIYLIRASGKDFCAQSKVIFN